MYVLAMASSREIDARHERVSAAERISLFGLVDAGVSHATAAGSGRGEALVLGVFVFEAASKSKSSRRRSCPCQSSREPCRPWGRSSQPACLGACANRFPRVARSGSSPVRRFRSAVARVAGKRNRPVEIVERFAILALFGKQHAEIETKNRFSAPLAKFDGRCRALAGSCCRLQDRRC